jgi:CelD/BcsL family acetyltransferase involved in cellulose biosynthesis
MDRSRVTEISMGCSTTAITISSVIDFTVLEAKWRDLETRSGASFFQSWTWTGCLAEERFTNPVLAEAREDGRTVALALFNRRGRTLHLGESGDPALDSIYIEYNGVLAETGRETELTIACLQAVRGKTARWREITGIGTPHLFLSGIGAEMATSMAQTGVVFCNRSLAAPFVDLAGGDGLFLDRRSPNTRQQLRRSNRDYVKTGPIVVHRAETVAKAHEYLDRLAALHQASWVARGRPGAFVNPFFGRFHSALIERGLARGEIDLLHVTAGSETIGFLYNFRHRERSLAYQSGFDYPRANPHRKPGMTCHHAAIEAAARWGLLRYDFLAGDDRYKRSMSDRADTLRWVEVFGPYSARLLARRAKAFVACHLRARIRLLRRASGRPPRESD